MAKAVFVSDKHLEEAKIKTKGTISYQKTKDGRVVAAVVPIRKKKRLKK